MSGFPARLRARTRRATIGGMKFLGLDVGSSSVKAGIVRSGKILGKIVRATYASRREGPRVEVDAPVVMAAVAEAIARVGPAARRVDAIGLSVMSPAWVAMDARGRALTPIITHQDRRSVSQAIEIERRVGKKRHLHIAGNRPFPGGMSSTTFAWYKQHDPALMRKADLIGHLNTLLHRQITGARIIDSSNASFTGLYDTVGMSGWSDVLCDAVGISKSKLPDIVDSNVVGGGVLPAAAAQFGLREGTPMVAGLIDTSSAMLNTGAAIGQMLNVCGSSDVLALCTERPHPDPNLLTRALGIGRRWVSVATISASGSALNWAREQLFRDLTIKQYHQLLSRLAIAPPPKPDEEVVTFAPYIVGERTSIEQKRASFDGIMLSTTREDLLAAMVRALAAASAERLPLLSQHGAKMLHRVWISGGLGPGLHEILHRDWPGKWTFHVETESSLRGLSRLIPPA
jgi:xylulokinase